MNSIGEYPQTYRVIYVRPGADRLVVSTHASRESAEVAVRLMRNGAAFGEILIESEGRRGRRRGRRAP